MTNEILGAKFSTAQWQKAIQDADAAGKPGELLVIFELLLQQLGLKKSLDDLQDAITPDLTKTDSFRVWVPNAVDIVKSDGAGAYNERKIQGYASTEAQDRQSEVVIQKGLDFSEFVQGGFYNDTHIPTTASVVGVPEEARLDVGRGWWTKGYLLKNYKRSNDIYDLAKALRPTGRFLGFSIEGKVVLRDAQQMNRVLKAKVRDVAITRAPVNTECTWSLVAKSFVNLDRYEEAQRIGQLIGPVLGAENTLFVKGEKLVSIGGQQLKLYRCGLCGVNCASEMVLDEHLHEAHTTPAPVLIRKATTLTKDRAIEIMRRVYPDFSAEICENAVNRILAMKGR